MTPPPGTSKNTPKCPTVRKQLADARAPAGSHLERVIRQNQEFELLHPSEAGDGMPYPAWLRVQWRKAHPDEYPPGQQVEYPMMLERVAEWLILHPDAAEDESGGGRSE